VTKFRCECGEQIRISGDIPNPTEWHLISDTDLEPLTGNRPYVPGRPLYEGDAIQTTALLAAMRYTYLCPMCGGLWVFWDGLDGAGAYYRRSSASVPPLDEPPAADD
jgi:hypothetical protein